MKRKPTTPNRTKKNRPKKLTRFNRWHGLLGIFMLYFHLEDYRLTMLALQLGHGEANPLIAFIFKVLGIPFTALLTTMILIAMLGLMYKNRRTNRYFTTSLVAVTLIMFGIFMRDVLILF